MKKDSLVVDVTDLVGYPGKVREVTGSRNVSLRVGESTIVGPMYIEGKFVGTTDGVQADYIASAEGNLQCVRCLTEWEEGLQISGSQHFSMVPDEDGYAIEGTSIDIFAPAKDELALGIPSAPLCKENCRGLCPNCGSDLNSGLCDGHGEDSDSPFAVLKDLFDS